MVMSDFKALLSEKFIQIENKLNFRKEVFSSYEEALKECSALGYKNEDIVKVVYEKTKRYRDDLTFQKCINKRKANVEVSLISLIKNMPDKVQNILDFGGACGHHYFIIRDSLDKGYKLNWHVVETKVMCNYGSRLENDELRFFGDIEEAKSKMPSIDIIYASGVIQYVKDPYYFVKFFLGTDAKYILFSRMCFTLSNHDVIAIQKSMLSWHAKWNGIGKLPEYSKDRVIKCPITLIQKKKFDELVKRKYQYEIEFKDDSGVVRVNNEPIVGLDLLCKLKSS